MVCSSKKGRLWLRKTEYGYECCYKLRGSNAVIVFERHLGSRIKRCYDLCIEAIGAQMRWQNACFEYESSRRTA